MVPSGAMARSAESAIAAPSAPATGSQPIGSGLPVSVSPVVESVSLVLVSVALVSFVSVLEASALLVELEASALLELASAEPASLPSLVDPSEVWDSPESPQAVNKKATEARRRRCREARGDGLDKGMVMAAFRRVVRWASAGHLAGASNGGLLPPSIAR